MLSLTLIPSGIHHQIIRFQIASLAFHMLAALVAKGMSLEKLTCVGHSLGAHICGLIAEMFQKKAIGIVAVIVALDPAGVEYRGVTNSWETDRYRLRRGNAAYTMVIHTCAFGLGWEALLGDADFYPNFGAFQPCCKPKFQNDITKYGKLCRPLVRIIQSIPKAIVFFYQAGAITSLHLSCSGCR